MKKNKKKIIKKKEKTLSKKKVRKKISKKKLKKLKKRIKIKKRNRRIKKKNLIKKKYIQIPKKASPAELILNIVRFQEKIKKNFSFKLSFDILSIDRKIQSFFQKIDNKFEQYKIVKAEEKKRIKIEEIEKAKKEKEEIKKKKIEEEKLQFKFKANFEYFSDSIFFYLLN